MIVVIGIDPGFAGGLSAVVRGRLVSSVPMPILVSEGKGKKRKSLNLELIRLYFQTFQRAGEVRVFLEKVGVMPDEGPVGAFSFGFGCGQLDGLCFGMELSVQKPAPQTWKKWTMEGQPKGTEASVVQRMFPKIKFTLPRCRKPHSGMTHSALIAVYGWRVLTEGTK